MTKKIYRGEVYYADLSPAIGSEQGGNRPVLIIQNDNGNRHSPTTQIIPITTQIKKTTLSSHIFISKECGLETDSIALIEQLRTIDKLRIGEFVGEVGLGELTLIEKALVISLGLPIKKATILELTLCLRCKSNFEDAGRLLIKQGWQDIRETCDYCHMALGLNYGVF